MKARQQRITARIVRRAQEEKTLAIDFDGPIHKFSEGFKDGSVYDEPTEGVFEAITKLIEKGFTVYIFTARKPFSAIREWLEEMAADYPEVLKLKITDQKIPAIAYIDDRGIRFTNWVDILNYFV